MKTAHLVLALLLIASSTFAQKLKKIKQKTEDNVNEEFYVLKSNPEIKQGDYKSENAVTGEIIEGFYSNNKRDKEWKWYVNTGSKKGGDIKILQSGTYNNGIKNGTWKKFNGGQYDRYTFYSNGMKDSVWIYRDGLRNLDKMIFYTNNEQDSVVIQYDFKSRPKYVYHSGSNQLLRYYKYEDTSAYFVKSEGEWVKEQLDHPAILLNQEMFEFLSDSIIYSKGKESANIPQIECIVDENGHVTKTILQNGDPGVIKAELLSNGVKGYNPKKCDDEILKAISEILKSEKLKWLPAKDDIKTVTSKVYILHDASNNAYINNSVYAFELDKPDKLPEFPGGDKALADYLSRTLKYPSIAQENGIQGRVYVKFTVTRSGELIDVKVIRGADPALDMEAVRVIKLMPNWIPAEVNNVPIDLDFVFPINFILDNRMPVNTNRGFRLQ
ncbi:energy transducer TonB [Saccharicrinis sp. FJH54]|uniref:energy transducer TonB n=1 Tax=Saccharicrinis sp. FJH54 TaxID=3344665 RepID=UPI0035D3FAD9